MLGAVHVLDILGNIPATTTKGSDFPYLLAAVPLGILDTIALGSRSIQTRRMEVCQPTAA